MTFKPKISISSSRALKRAWTIDDQTFVHFREGISAIDFESGKCKNLKNVEIGTQNGLGCFFFSVGVENRPEFVLVDRHSVVLLSGECRELYKFEDMTFSRHSWISEDRKRLYAATTGREVVRFTVGAVGAWGSGEIEVERFKVPGGSDWTNDLNSVYEGGEGVIVYGTDDGCIGVFDGGEPSKRPYHGRFRDIYPQACNYSDLYSQQINVVPGNVLKYGDKIYKFKPSPNTVRVEDKFNHPRIKLTPNFLTSTNTELLVAFSAKFISLVAIYDIPSTTCTLLIEEPATVMTLFLDKTTLAYATTDSRVSVWTKTTETEKSTPKLVQFKSEIKTTSGAENRFHIAGQSHPPGAPQTNEIKSLKYVWHDFSKTSRAISSEEEATVPEEAFCPITQELLREPILAPDNRVYEREAIFSWLERHGTSPFTRQKMFRDDLQPLPETHENYEIVQKYMVPVEETGQKLSAEPEFVYL